MTDHPKQRNLSLLPIENNNKKYRISKENKK